jgi:CheY-like chemotaxis protein
MEIEEADPLTEEALSATEEEPEGFHDGAVPGSQGDDMPRVLVVDDDESLRLLYTSELADEGYDIDAVSSGREALEYLDGSKPDVVILDIKMEGMDGLAVLDEIMKRDKTIPVVLNTAYSNFKSDFTTWSADAYIVKSSDLSELKKTIKQVLGEA